MLVDKNIKVLEGNARHWIGMASNETNLYPKYIISEDKKIEYFENQQQNIITIIDEYNNENEINCYKKEVIFVFGINNIQEIKGILRKKNKNSIVLVIEPRLAFFQHALTNKDLAIFDNQNVYLFADDKVENITEFLKMFILDINLIGLFRNIVIYLNSYYKNYDLNLTKKIITLIQQYIRSATTAIGNDVHDSLQGLEQNLINLTSLSKAKNPYYLKNKFKDKPAVMVAAGPSLNKNIHYLKEYKDKVIIIAVDTIVERLLQENIVPHFVCSVERVDKVYEYFYKDKDIPKEVTLVAPLVLDPRVFEKFKGEYIIPFRTEVTEYRWLQNMLEIKEDCSTPVGLSCAHMAFGIAQHLGCSPIIMIGQDLAYDTITGRTHVNGTTYDDKTSHIDHANDEIVTGYYNNQVNTTTIWLTFKYWFESQILNNNLKVINATEGGAKIYNTEQMPLKLALANYAADDLENIYQLIKESQNYNIDLNVANTNFETDLIYIRDLKERCKHYFDLIKNMHINSTLPTKKKISINTNMEKVHILIEEVFKHSLLMHNAQPLIVTFLWEYNGIEEILNVENLKIKRNILGRFIAALTVAIDKVEECLVKSMNNLK